MQVARTRNKLLTGVVLLAMLAALLPALVLAAAPARATTGDLVITGVVDGPLTGGVPKAIEVFAVNNIPDLSVYGLGSANNGGGSDGEEFTFPAASATAGDFIYVASESTGFTSFFGFAPHFTSGAASINGDDAIELFMSGSVVDVFGDINVDGTGQPWEYLDGWAYRVDGTGQDGSTFVLGNWTFSGPNALDGETTNATAATPFPIGTYSTTVGPPPIVVDCGPPLVTDEGLAASTTITASDADDEIVDIFLLADDVLPGGSLTEGAFTPSAGVGDPATLEVNLDALADVGVYQAEFEAQNLLGDIETCTLDIEVESTTVVITEIFEIQGSGPASPLDGATVVTEGTVIGDFQASNELNGFFLQTPLRRTDGDPDTSDGIFVSEGASPVDVAVGDRVQVEGEVDEFSDLTELTNVTTILNFGPDLDGVPAATPIALPFPAGEDEAVEGMLVTFPDPVFATDTFNLGRFGEVVISQGGPLVIPTNEVAPGAAAVAAQAANDANQIILDDGSSSSFFADPPIHIAPDGTLRRGDSAANVTGAMSFAFGNYRIHPTAPVVFDRDNPREDPEDLGGDVRVASFNVLNYWTTLDDGVNDARGADSAAEFDRQTDKTVAAILELDAAIVGLQELENNGPTAIGALVDGLNAATGPGTWAAVPDPPYPGGLESTNAIKVGIIYQPALAAPVGPSVADEDPVFATDRPPIAQTFDASGEVFTVVVNHFKSKSPSGATGPDEDQGDGQGAYNFRRTNQALALIDFVAQLQADSGDNDVLAIGDFNSYRLEDPITALNGALVNLGESFVDEADQYSLVFFGQQGLLDYAFANAGMVPRITGVDVWHANADEPRALDYNDDVQDVGESSASNLNPPSLYLPDQWRASDHDAVIVAFRLTTAVEDKQMVADSLAALLPTGDAKDDKAIQKAIDAINDSLDPDFWADGDHLTKQGKKVFNEERKAVKELGKVKGSAAGAAQAAIGELVAVDAELAQRAIDIAIATGGKQSEIDKALSEMAKAAGELAKSKPDKAIDHYKKAWDHAVKAVKDARFATFNASLNRSNAGDLVADLSAPGNSQAAAVAEIIQRTRPEVLLINEFDFDAGGVAAALFQDNYLSVSQGGADPIEYPFRYVAPSNTGIPSGFDLDNSGGVGGPGDAFGFGFFPGQFGMAVFSMHPIDVDAIRTFQNFLWKDMPGALLPDDPNTPAPADWYTPAELDVFRLSSKSHWDVPILVGDRTVHFLTSHPTPPVFDGPEDRNGTRNHDEIRFWADYIDPATSGYIYDDAGNFGGLAGGDRFVIAGDQNSDPFDGDSIPGSIQQLLDHPKVNTKVTPASPGGTEQAAAQGNANTLHLSDPAFDTADFFDGFPPAPFGGAPGNLRADYVLPSKNLKIDDAAVFWPESTDPLFPLVGTFPFPSSDHRLVWVDVKV